MAPIPKSAKANAVKGRTAKDLAARRSQEVKGGAPRVRQSLAKFDKYTQDDVVTFDELASLHEM